MKRFSIDKNEEIKTDFDLNLLYVIGIGEMDNHVLLFCYDYQNGPVPISIFNTTSKKIVGVLPKSDSIEMDSEEQMKALKVTVRNNLLLLTDEARLKLVTFIFLTYKTVLRSILAVATLAFIVWFR